MKRTLLAKQTAVAKVAIVRLTAAYGIIGSYDACTKAHQSDKP